MTDSDTAPTQNVDLNSSQPSISESPFGQVPIEITISVGRARPLIRDLISLGQGAVLPLDRGIDDPVELFIGDRLIARGVLTELDREESGQLGVRLTEVADLEKGL